MMKDKFEMCISSNSVKINSAMVWLDEESQQLQYHCYFLKTNSTQYVILDFVVQDIIGKSG